MNSSSDRIRDLDPHAAVIDLRETMDRLGDDEELLGDLIVLYFEDAPALLSRLEEGVASENLVQAREAAHALKGIAANFGAARAVAAGQAVESYAAKQDLAATRAELAELKLALQKLDQALRDLHAPR